MSTDFEDCDCGFVDSGDPTQTTFTSLLVVNFTTTTQKQLEEFFVIANYNIDQPGAPYVRNFSADQVALSDRGLELTVSPADGRDVPCAGIFTKESSFFYGSYRARYLAGTVPGTVSAFYNYNNDSSEVDIEYLSAWEEPTLLCTVKPQKYLSNGNPDNSTFAQETWNQTSTAFERDFQEWSFVWLPDKVYYGLNGNYSRNLIVNVPQAPGHIALNHWSNGDPRYSTGPPVENVTHTVSFLQAVYNDPNVTSLACKRRTSACVVADGRIEGQPDSSTSVSIASSGGCSLTPYSGIHFRSAHGLNPSISGWLLLLSWLYWLF